MSKVKNYYHEEVSNRDGEALEPYECANCNGMTMHGTLCDECLEELKAIARKPTTIERLPNMLTGKQMHKTKRPPR